MKTPEQVDAELDEIERRWKAMKSNAADFVRLIIVTVVAIVVPWLFLLVIPA